MEDLQSWAEAELEDLENILKEAIEATNLNAEQIRETINSTSESTGYIFTDEFTKIWDNLSESFGQNYDIESSIDDVCLGIQDEISHLADEDGLRAILDNDTYSIVNEITSVDNAVGGVQTAIQQTNSALAQIQSRIAEYASAIKSGIDSAKAAAQSAQKAAENAQKTANDAKNTANDAKKTAQKAASTPTTSTTGNKIKYVYDGHEYTSHAEAYNEQSNDLQKYLESYKKYDPLHLNTYRSRWLAQHPVEIVRYAKGGRISDKDNPLDILAQSLGEDHMVAAKEGERILTAKQNENFEKLANAFSDLSSEELAKYSLFTGTKLLNNMPTLQMPTLRSDLVGANSTEINGGISINLPNVTNKEEFVNWLKTDGQIEKIVQSMTLGKLQGRNSYDKMKY